MGVPSQIVKSKPAPLFAQWSTRAMSPSLKWTAVRWLPESHCVADRGRDSPGLGALRVQHEVDARECRVHRGQGAGRVEEALKARPFAWFATLDAFRQEREGRLKSDQKVLVRTDRVEQLLQVSRYLDGRAGGGSKWRPGWASVSPGQYQDGRDQVS
jgi:hypothetical protein